MMSNDLNQRWEFWKGIVVSYTVAKLTKENDILPALSGLASATQELGFGTYVAGLWEEDLALWLGWRCRAPGRRPTSYTTPTFSWASTIGLVVWNYNHASIEPLVEILKIHTGARDAQPFGEVSGSFLELKGALVSSMIRLKEDAYCHDPKSNLHYHLEPELYGNNWAGLRFDTWEDATNGVNDSTTYCVPLLEEISGRERVLHCLVLIKVSKGVFRRIGTVEYSGNHISEEWFSYPQKAFRII
jgi:hypothetical protein